MQPWEVAAFEVPLVVRIALGVALGALAVGIADVLDLSSGWAVVPGVLSTVVAVGLLGVSAAIAASLVAAVGASAFVIGETGTDEGSEAALVAIYLISAGFIVAMGGRLRFLAKRLLAAYERQGEQQTELESTWAQLEALTNSAPAGMCLVDRDLRFVNVNHEMARLNGLSVEQHLGRPVSAVPGLDPQALEAFRSVLAGGPPIRDRELSTTASGSKGARHLLASWYPVRRPDGQIIGAGALVQDITRRKVAEERLWLLAELSDMLEEPLDGRARAQALAHLLVPRLADLSMMLTPAPEGGLALQAIACSDPARGVLAADLIDRYPEAFEATAFANVLDGETVVINDYVPARDAVSASHLEALRAMGVGAAACFPIVGGERTHGVLLLAKFAPTPGFDASEVTYSQTIIARAAVALDNAYLYDRMSSFADEEHERAELLARMESRQRYIADTLQRSLLPDALPELPSLALASAFRPAGLGLEVGGDTFDIFDVDDQWVAYIADVCGKGPHAAARTGLVRYTVRAEARHNADPVELLRLVNTAMLRTAEDESASFVTMVVVNVRRRDDGDLDVTVANGGHPPPILLQAGTARELGVAGTVVGAIDEAEFGREQLRMRPGDVLLLYTDGVTEARAAHPAGRAVELYGEERLRASVQESYDRGVVHAHGLVDAVVADIDTFSGGQLRDDLAVLALQLLPIPTVAVAGLPQQRSVLGEIGRQQV
ncbi:MAG: SpoIIE family protein phosphatase [Candidatus Nanopelagicales bacterium]